MFDDEMFDVAVGLGPSVDIVEAAIGDDCDIDIHSFDPSDETEAILIGLDDMMPTPTKEEHADDED